MKPGRTPKPTAVKRLEGNPGKRKLNEDEPQMVRLRRTPNPPDFLNEEAKGIWRTLGKRLMAAGLLTAVDTHALAMFCVVAARWIDAEKKLEKSGVVLTSKKGGGLYQNPYLSVANKAWDQMRRMLGEFGLTPAERSRLRVAAIEEEPSLAEQLFAMAGGDVKVGTDGR